MSDPRIDVKDPPTVRLRPIASSIIGPTPSYSSVAEDDIELTSYDGTSVGKRNHPGTSTWIRTPNELLSGCSWTHRYFWVDTWQDVKNFSWGWLGRRFVSHFLPFTIITLLIFLFSVMTTSPGAFTQDDGGVCKPDGTFELSFDDYSPWKRDAIFAININFGSMSFGAAKLVDVCWDVVC